MEGHQQDSRGILDVVRVRRQRCMVEEVLRRLAALGCLPRGDGQFIQVLPAALCVPGRIGVEHVAIAAPIYHRIYKCRDVAACGRSAQADDQCTKSLQRGRGAFRQLAAIDHFFDRLPQRQRALVRIASQQAQRALADAARRHVDDPRQTDRVFRGERDPDVCEHVLDFLALVEGHASHQDVAHPLPPQGILDQSRLRVGAVQHPDLRAGIHVQQFPHRARHVAGLCGPAHGAIQHDRISFQAIGPETLALPLLVVRDDSPGRVQDGPRRAVVLLQADHTGAWEIPLEAQDVADVSAAPGID